MPVVIAVDPSIWRLCVVTEGQQSEGKRASPLSIGIAVPVEVIVVDHRPIERRTIGRRNDDDRRRLDYGARLYRPAGENPAPARRAAADLDAIVRYRPLAANCRSGG